MSIPQFEEIIEPNDQTEARKVSLEAISALVGNVYPNKFSRTDVSGGEDTITALKHFDKIADIESRMAEIKANLGEGERPPAEKKDELNTELKALGNVRIAGRLTTPTRGNFVHLTDGISKLQVYCNKKGPLALIKNDGADTFDEENGWALWQLLDHGDLIGAEGYLFVTNTGEVSVHVEKLQFLAKAMLPMPDKMHGIADPELQRRYRYADLIASTLQIEHDGLTTREVFERRAKLISGIRRFLDDAGFIEVETPMLTPKATGAAAKPFETHHNALDIPLYARVAPELYLKRLVVGGFEKVYELNRNFRNEGLSQRHNPEFTMLEFYIAYMDVNGMMDFAETMIKDAVAKANDGNLVVKYGENEIDFGNFERITMADAVARGRNLNGSEGVLLDAVTSTSGIEEDTLPTGRVSAFDDAQLLEYFEEHVEHTLIQPTFIIDYPKSISPLSKADPSNPNIAERFELFINGMEVANGFSELNDPKEQYERFVDQMSERERGDEEAMVLDEDYIRALSYGMPPAAGIGIGIDRLVMMLTNKHSIRDVILFPHMRPEKGSLTTEDTESTEN
ncbi:MAG: lysine--tRNA ligase [Chloracidobacterium sp.]|nr:lysine--tRNA ligase [Chloracidobacterium sp.]